MLNIRIISEGNLVRTWSCWILLDRRCSSVSTLLSACRLTWFPDMKGEAYPSAVDRLSLDILGLVGDPVLCF